MQEVIAQILLLDVNDVSIKATTTEKMGFVGREEGLVAYATLLLQK
jgi:2-C-methyl-D-erythritol 2,4-cyclodiphosphate synthase